LFAAWESSEAWESFAAWGQGRERAENIRKANCSSPLSSTYLFLLISDDTGDVGSVGTRGKYAYISICPRNL
jgi:hypothetical protein